ncbi:MAG TPA: hypothetical protein VMG11_04180 [Steroidobacteraceae bacterium]|nr:hypothetical protein [Steroidobacteraceae bacterium]
MLTATLENILNRGLPRSPRARALCSELAGEQLAVELRGIGEFAVESDGNALRITMGNTTGARARISGGPLGLLGLAAAANASAERTDVQVSGDAELAAKFRELLRLLRPDLEEELALAIGDVPAHQLARFARASVGWLRHAGDTALRNVAEFLAHERGDLVSRAEGRQFLSGVDALRDDVDRLEARIELLAQRRGARRPEP